MRKLNFYIVAFVVVSVITISITWNAMAYDPLSKIKDRELSITKAQINQMVEFRNTKKFTELPGYETKEEQERLSKVFNRLLDVLISGVEANSTKLWVMKQFQVALKQVELEDSEGREDFGEHLVQLMNILEIKSSNGLLNFYL